MQKTETQVLCVKWVYAKLQSVAQRRSKASQASMIAACASLLHSIALCQPFDGGHFPKKHCFQAGDVMPSIVCTGA